MIVECEGGAAAWLAGTLVALSVQGEKGGGVMALSESFFLSLLYLAIRRPLWLVFLHSSASSGT